MRVGILGCGLIGKRRAEVVSRTGLGQVVVVADVNQGRAAALAAEIGCSSAYDWRSVVERADLDVLVVSTSNNALAEASIAALESGKHVLCEKPLGRNAHEARAMYEASLKAWRLLKTGFNHRHHPGIWKARNLLGEGAIGEPYLVRTRYGHGGRPGYDEEWRANRAISGGGELLDQGVHVIDLCRWFLGDFVEVLGYTQNYFWKGTGGAADQTEPVDDNSFGLLRTADGRVAQMHVSWTQWKNLFSFEVFGRDGYLSVEGLGGSYGPEKLVWGRRKLESGLPDLRTFEFDGADESWVAEWREFVGAIQEGRQPLANGLDGWRVMEVVDALYLASSTSRSVKVAPIESVSSTP